ncbi:MAG TPA: nitroreductase family deazaflavin-dependent oxidoreductase [Acidimicrobiales bacterium]|nr:nitroreductase family deazaflavin-dependent oxidoreductase [Acidimicrobiales bacterium]
MKDDPPFCYLTTVGRRSGTPHTIEIWFAPSGPTLYLLAGGRHRADWVRNLVASPAVRVRVGEADLSGRGRVVPAGSDEDARARQLLLARYQAPGSNDLEAWGRTALAVAVDLSGPR